MPATAALAIAVAAVVAIAGGAVAETSIQGASGSGGIVAAEGISIDPAVNLNGVRAAWTRPQDGAAAVQNRTAIDYRLARDGLGGQIGYFCRQDASPIANDEAAVPIDAKDDRLLGATVRLAF